MSEPLRSPGWAVRPSFVAHGPTAPVTLLFDDDGLTQLAGVFPVAWQTPWPELAELTLARVGRGLVFGATVADVRYEWRRRGLDDFEELRAVVLEHGGTLSLRRRRLGVAATVIVVLVASLGGVIAALLASGPNADVETSDARSVNLSLSDLPSGWSTTSVGYLSYLVPPSGRVITSAPTTAPVVDVVTPVVTKQFQRCLGVSAGNDRVFGGAAQLPDVQVTSPIFHLGTPYETEVATTSQYYRTTGMVRRDVAEMSTKNFGACFVASNATILLSEYASQVIPSARGINWNPATFAKGWARGGVVSVDLPGVSNPYQLVVAVVAGGHYEVTLTALVPSWRASRRLLGQLVGVLKTRVLGGSAA